MLARPSDGVVTLSTQQSRFDRFIGDTFLDPTQVSHALAAAFLAPPGYDARLQEVVVVVAAPVVDPSIGNTLGIVLGFVRGSQLSDVAAPVPGLGPTGHAFVITRDSYQLGSMVTSAAATSSGIDQARMHHVDGNGVYLDQNGQQVFGVYRWLTNYQMALLVEEGTAEALAPLGRFAGVLIGISLSAIAVSLLGEMLTALQWLGAALLAASVLLVARESRLGTLPTPRSWTPLVLSRLPSQPGQTPLPPAPASEATLRPPVEAEHPAKPASAPPG